VDDGISLLFWIENPPVGGPQCGLLWEFLFSIIGKMSFTQNRRGDFQGIKTREFILQDSSGNFPLRNSILSIGDDTGTVSTTQNLNIPNATVELNELVTKADSTGRYLTIQNAGITFANASGNINNPGAYSIQKDPVRGHFQITTNTVGKVNMEIDETGSMVMAGFSTQYNPNVPSASDIQINGNIYANGSDTNGTGQVHTSRLVFPDRSNTSLKCSVSVDNQQLLWKSLISAPINVTGWQPLLDNTQQKIAVLGGTTDIGAISAKIDELIRLIANSKVLFTVSGVPTPQPAVTFQTAVAMKIFIGTSDYPFTYNADSSIDPSYNTITDFTSFLNTEISQNIFVYNSQANNISIFIPSNTTIRIIDNGIWGGAQRLLNHLGIYTIVPTYGVVTLTTSVYGASLPNTNIGSGSLCTNPTNIVATSTGSRHITIQWNAGTDGDGGRPPRYGIYLNNAIYDIIDTTVARASNTDTNLYYTFYNLLPNTNYTCTVTTIGIYNESPNSMPNPPNLLTTTEIPVTPTGISLTQYLPTNTYDRVIPFDTTTYGSPTGTVVTTLSGTTVLPLDTIGTSYVYASDFTIQFPDDYKNVYIGIDAVSGSSVDAYQLRIDNDIRGVWQPQTLNSPQYFGPFSFDANIGKPASLVTMKINTPYSFRIFFVQIQKNYAIEIAPAPSYASPILDNLCKFPSSSESSLSTPYRQIPLLEFCIR
jgi:hypothetical protein